ncbi:MAG: endonuclease [Modestobacter sp.]|nr:endonuclease [Modestobacter sp.]
MGELQSTLDSLAADDLHGMFGPHLLDRLGELVRASNRLAAEVIRTVRECEVAGAAECDGLTSMQSWLRGHGHLSEGRRGGWCARGGRWSTCPWSPQPSPTV